MSTRDANLAERPASPVYSPPLERAVAPSPSPATGGTVEYDGSILHDGDIIGAGTGLRDVVARVAQVASTDAPVLLEGETGSGKEVIARMIHARSRRASGPMIRVNCGAIPSSLVDSELFGHERGSFTGATATKLGWFERADGGTLFLDEVAELPLAAQVRLLRVLQDGTLERVGGGRSLEVDVRVVTATHRDLRAMCAEGAFRQDLWYRISVFSVKIPPLRGRMQDVPALAAHFAARAGLRLTGVALVPKQEELEGLLRYDWPGNVRELAAVIERAAILGGGRHLEVAAALGDIGDLRAGPNAAIAARGDPTRAFAPLEEAVRAHIERALALSAGRIEGQGGAADLLGVNPHTLRGKMRKLRIDWSRFRTR
ncbi:MAG: sigma-54-dependent Fis family transcriptional regulator [Labilithrix sp.]|nr:sigma-54-dependent Fis family transcriptional regulator [Labilithrix sp.]